MKREGRPQTIDTKDRFENRAGKASLLTDIPQWKSPGAATVVVAVTVEMRKSVDSVEICESTSDCVDSKTMGHAVGNWQYKWCRGGELNSLRRPFQGRALPVSYPGTGQ
jgi:hypothetical protein